MPPLLRSSSHEVASNNNAHSQTGVSVLQATPAESFGEPQSDTEFRNLQVLRQSLDTCERNVVLVGDWACGKSALLRVFINGTSPGYICGDEIFQTFTTNIKIEATLTELALWDTPGQEDYDRARRSVYPGAHVVLICFSIDNPDSLVSIHEKWLPEVLHFCAGVPIVLVGTKSDLRYNGTIIAELHKTSMHPVTYEEALDAQVKIGAKAYMECSAKRGDGVAEVFEIAVKCVLERKPVEAKGRRGLLSMFGMSRD